MNEHPLRSGVDIALNDIETGVGDRRPSARLRHRFVRRTTACIGALGVTGLVLIGCGADPNDVLQGLAPSGIAPAGGSAINGVLDEWTVRADATTVHAGQVTFTFTNIGTVIHEMLVTRTDIAPGHIAVDPTNQKFNEDDPASKVLDEVSELDPGKTGSVTMNLTPGIYQLVCNVPEHYTDGMYMTLTVTP